MPHTDVEKRRAYNRAYRALREKDPAVKSRRQAANRARERLRMADPEKRAKHRDYVRKHQRAQRLVDVGFVRRRMVANAATRAKRAGVPFSLTVSSVTWLATCPILGIPLRYVGEKEGGHGQPDSPSIDRIDCRGGYTPENTVVISWRANRLKSDATADELRRIADFMEVFG